MRYPDWKAWKALAPELTHECYGDYVKQTSEILDKDVTIAVFDAKKFGDYIRENNLDFSPEKMSTNRANWVAQLELSEIVTPLKATLPESFDATLSIYGSRNYVEYCMVAMHQKSLVRDYYQFNSRDYRDVDNMMNTIFLYIQGFCSKKVYTVDGILKPEKCSCCGKAKIGLHDGDDLK